MSLGLNLQQRLVQKLAMTPQMQQSIQLLQLSTMQLEQLVRKEMLENPLLEVSEEIDEEEETAQQEQSDKEEPETQIEKPAEDNSPATIDNSVSEQVESTQTEASTPDALTQIDDEAPSDVAEADMNTFENMNDIDAEWATVFNDADTRTYLRTDQTEQPDFTQYVSLPTTLSEYLLKQLHLTNLQGKEFEIGEFIIGSLNDDGYVVTAIEDIAEQLGISTLIVEKVLRVVQTFDPTGIAARDLRECLLIQVEDHGIKNPIVIEIITNHFDDFKKKKIHKMARSMGIDDESVLRTFEIIAKLEPKPGRSKSYSPPSYITSDVIVRKIDNDYMVVLNDGDVSHLRINPYYKRVLLDGDNSSKQEKEYALEKYKSAVWLLRNIQKRKSTILKVTKAIMKHQRKFLTKGIGHLRPLTLKEIAEKVELHESTVARVTSNKYVETPRGTFRLKFFFSSGLNTTSGIATSSTNIKEMLKNIIEEEDPRRPFSDESIAKMVNDKGIQIARRTIAKYRKQLKILSAKMRKS